MHLWRTAVQSVRPVGVSARARKAVSPLPVPLTPRSTHRSQALVEGYSFDYSITSQIAAVLELSPEERRIR